VQEKLDKVSKYIATAYETVSECIRNINECILNLSSFSYSDTAALPAVPLTAADAIPLRVFLQSYRRSCCQVRYT
jgi:hypothetical protein